MRRGSAGPLIWQDRPDGLPGIPSGMELRMQKILGQMMWLEKVIMALIAAGLRVTGAGVAVYTTLPSMRRSSLPWSRLWC